MKYAHSVKLTAFSYEHEDSESILNAFLRLFPFRLENNKVILGKSNATGFNDRKIVVFEVVLAKNSLINQFLRNLLNNLDESQRKQILQQAGSRLDKELNFFLRFDKELWINEEKLALTDSGKCFHIRIGVAAFPRKRGAALGIIKNLFSANEGS